MAEPLKHFFDDALVRRLARSFVDIHPGFPADAFIEDATRDLDELELMERGRRIARALARALPDDYPRAVALLLASLDGAEPPAEGGAMAPFFYLPHTMFVAERGLAHFEESMRALEALTKRFTAEFAIRSFLEREPARTWAQLAVWATDDDPHVRRLVSEGTRPRLPWGARVRALLDDPEPGLALLERLKDDPSLYVRRSVANHLNDVARDHPDRVVDVCARWTKGASEERAWIVRHALRGLVKKGDAGALGVLGFAATERAVDVTGAVHPARVPLGGAIELSVHVENRARTRLRVVVDLAVHFVKARGQTSRKVFKGRVLELVAGERVSFSKKISLAPMTTRTHYPGRHLVEALVNGRAVRLGEVDVLEAD